MPTARAVKIEGKGGPEVLAIGELEVREPGPGEVAVEVAAAGLNRADTLQRRGFYPAPPGAPPDVPGLEYAGTIAAVGEGVSAWSLGDRVMGITAGGGMATRLVTHEREVIPVPDDMELTAAAAIPEVFLTAYDALFAQGGLGIGQTVLIHSVASGVGTAALQLAQATGATAIGTSRTERKLAACRELGLPHGIVAKDGAFADAVREVAPRGVDLILDTVGAAYLDENLKALSRGGTVIVIGLMGGTKGTANLGALLQKRARLMGSVLRSRPLEEKAALTQAFRRDVLPLLTRGVVKPVIDAVMPMDEIADAHTRMEANDNIGKIVLRW